MDRPAGPVPLPVARLSAQPAPATLLTSQSAPSPPKKLAIGLKRHLLNYRKTFCLSKSRRANVASVSVCLRQTDAAVPPKSLFVVWRQGSSTHGGAADDCAVAISGVSSVQPACSIKQFRPRMSTRNDCAARSRERT